MLALCLLEHIVQFPGPVFGKFSNPRFDGAVT
jgi:hypothetical protein